MMMLTQHQCFEEAATDSVFPRIDRWLDSGDHQQALRFLASGFGRHTYRSMVDYVFAQVFPGWRFDIRRFYAGNGPQLRKMTTAAERKVMQAEMLVALEIAHQLWCERRRSSWVEIRLVVKELAA